jgi:hypothetical protein
MISELILAAHFLAAYASHPLVAHRMARLAASLPATALTGLDFHQLDSIDWFHSLMCWFLQSQALLGAICFIFQLTKTAPHGRFQTSPPWGPILG